MNDYCVELNIGLSPLREGYDISAQILPQISISLDNINPKLVDFFNDCGLKVVYMESFKRGPKNKSRIHIDTFTANNEFVKINWIYGGKNSFMNWYYPKSPEAGIKKLTIANTEYIEYLPRDVDLIATHDTQNKTYIIQAGIPHEVINPEEIRYCICCVLRDKFGKKLTMHETKKLLATYINNS